MKKLLTIIFNILAALLLVLLVSGLLAVTVRGVWGNVTPDYIVTHLRVQGMPFELSPERGRFALTYSVAENHSFEFTRDIAAMAVPDLATVNGKYVSLFAPGVSIIALPFYLLGRLWGLSQVFAFASVAVFAGLNVYLIYLIVRRFTTNGFAAIAAGLTFLFATSAWAYAGVLYQHHITTFLMLLIFFILLHSRNILLTLFVGFLFGFSLFVEYPNAVFFLPLLLLLLAKHIDITPISDRIRFSFNFSVLFIFLGFALGMIPFLWYNTNAYNDPFQLAGTLKAVRTLEATDSASLAPQFSYKPKTVFNFFRLEKIPQGADVLLTSTDRGLMVFSPVILMGIIGLIPLFTKHRAEAYTLTGTIGVFVGLYMMWGDPWGGWAFGPRYMIPVVALLAIGLGVAIHTYGRALWFGILYLILLNYSITINAVGALTTLQIPPSVEVDAQLLPKLTYLHNFDLLYQGISGSYVFNTFIRFLIPLHVFAGLVIMIVSWMISLMYLLAQKKSKNS